MLKNNLSVKIIEKLNSFFGSINNEIKETKESIGIIRTSFIRGQKLTDQEKDSVYQQGIDVLKTLIVLIIFMIPGGSLILILTGVLKLNKYLLPSSFIKK